MMSKKTPPNFVAIFTISTPIDFCRTVISFVPPLWEVGLHDDTCIGSFSWQKPRSWTQNCLLGIHRDSSQDEVVLNQTDEGEDYNFHTKLRSTPGPKIKAPPCWPGSPWKSKAGPVIALHILFMLPRSVFDFTWGLRTKQNSKIQYKRTEGEQQYPTAAVNGWEFPDYQCFDKIQPTRDCLAGSSLPICIVITLFYQNVLVFVLCTSRQGDNIILTWHVISFTSFHAKRFINFPLWIYVHFVCIPS